MSFDWIRFLEARGIEYATKGPNVARGNIAVACPFCGDDPSHHMTISLKGRGWRCWRRHAHRGKSPVRLVASLLNISWVQAASIVGYDLNIEEDWMSNVMGALGMRADDQVKRARGLRLPGEFKPFDVMSSGYHFYFNYLKGRGFTGKQISKLTERYAMYWAHRGAWRGRVVFSVYEDKQLVSWVGRAVSPGVRMRYKALSTDREKAADDGVDPALGPLPDYLLWYDKLMRSDAHTLVAVEGPFDALKVNVLGRQHGVVSTCFFTQGPSERQVDLLYELAPRFQRRVLLLDEAAMASTIEVSQRLVSLEFEPVLLTPKYKDPGELDESGFAKILLADR